MNFPDGLLSTTWLVAGHLIYWPVLIFAVWRAPWRHLRSNESMHVLLGATVVVMLLWTMKAGFAAGLNLHLLGATVLTLMFGWEFAVIATSVVVLGLAINSGAGWHVLAVNALMMGVVPVTVSYGIFRLVDRRLPNNFFVYIFLCAFFGAAAAIAAVGVVTTAVLSLSHAYSLEYVVDNYLRYYPLMVFPEGFISGMLMTVFVVYRPRWVSTFDDSRYLKNH